MDYERFFGAAVMGFIGAAFWLVALSVPLWLVRKFAPRAEWWLYTPLWTVIARLARTARRALLEGRRPSTSAARRPGRHPAAPPRHTPDR